MSVESAALDRLPYPGDVFADLAIRDAAKIIADVLSALTDRQQVVILRRYHSEETFEQIAVRLGVTKQAIHLMHGRALLKLEQQLAIRSIRKTSDVL